MRKFKSAVLGVLAASLIAMGSLIGTDAHAAALSSQCGFSQTVPQKSAGKATYGGEVKCTGGMKAIKITATLQRKISGNWTSLESSTSSNANGAPSLAAGGKGSCAAGTNQYRSYVAATDWNGGQSILGSNTANLSC